MIIVGNWKAYVETSEKAKALFAAAKRSSKDVEVVIAPPAPYIGMLSAGNRSAVRFGAQDVSVCTGGAHTGEVTAKALANVGASHVIVGHSERRAAGETDALIAEKVQHVLAQGMTPILCVGEQDRDADARYLAQLRGQIVSAFTPLSPKERLSVIIAYEPVWAIGKTAAEAITPTDLTEMVLYIRKVLGDLVPGKSAARVPVLYGGSVEADGVRTLASGTGIDGFLVGRASTDPKAFSAIIKAVS